MVPLLVSNTQGYPSLSTTVRHTGWQEKGATTPLVSLPHWCHCPTGAACADKRGLAALGCPRPLPLIGIQQVTSADPRAPADYRPGSLSVPAATEAWMVPATAAEMKMSSSNGAAQSSPASAFFTTGTKLQSTTHQTQNNVRNKAGLGTPFQVFLSIAPISASCA